MDDIKRPSRSNQPVVDVSPRPAPQLVQRDTAPATSRPAPATPAPEPAPTPTILQPEPQPEEDKAPALAELPFPSRSQTPIAAIVVAIVVSLGLIGLTIFAFLKTNNGTNKSNDTNAAEPADETVSPNDVDDSSEALDQELNSTNDGQDFSDTDLSDQTLGL